MSRGDSFDSDAFLECVEQAEMWMTNDKSFDDEAFLNYVEKVEAIELVNNIDEPRTSNPYITEEEYFEMQQDYSIHPHMNQPSTSDLYITEEEYFEMQQDYCSQDSSDRQGCDIHFSDSEESQRIESKDKEHVGNMINTDQIAYMSLFTGKFCETEELDDGKRQATSKEKGRENADPYITEEEYFEMQQDYSSHSHLNQPSNSDPYNTEEEYFETQQDYSRHPHITHPISYDQYITEEENFKMQQDYCSQDSSERQGRIIPSSDSEESQCIESFKHSEKEHDGNMINRDQISYMSLLTGNFCETKEVIDAKREAMSKEQENENAGLTLRYYVFTLNYINI